MKPVTDTSPEVAGKTNPIPEDCHCITPYLTAPDAARLIEFLKKAFAGVERARISRPDGTILHAQVRVADSLLMIGDPQGQWKPRPCVLYFYVANMDATYKEAIKAGATSVVEPTYMFYGDRCLKASEFQYPAPRAESVSGCASRSGPLSCGAQMSRAGNRKFPRP